MVPLGQSGRVVFSLRSPAGTRLASVTADLIGDGESGWTIDTIGDAALIAGVRYTPTRKGIFNLVVTVVDANGCSGATGLRREVRVP